MNRIKLHAGKIKQLIVICEVIMHAIPLEGNKEDHQLTISIFVKIWTKIGFKPGSKGFFKFFRSVLYH